MRGEVVRKLVTRDGPNGRERRYKPAPSTDPQNKELKFRISSYYLGTAVADCIGCNLRCVFCWATDEVRDYSRKTGVFYSPHEVASALMNIAEEKRQRYLRISQGEPTLDPTHLLEVMDGLEEIGRDIPLILETNGMIMGRNKDLSKDLSKYSKQTSKRDPSLHVRVSLKGATRRLFQKLTGGCDGKFYELQFKALENCVDNGISVHAAVMLDFISTTGQVRALRENLASISPELARSLEFERLFLDKEVRGRLASCKVNY